MIKLNIEDELFTLVANSVYNLLKLKGNACVEVVFAECEEIRQVNLAARGIDSVTDVLSFPYLNTIIEFNQKNYPYDYVESEKSVQLGSIMICLDRAKAQADEYGHSLQRETAYLFLHGLLHLLGYDHINEDEKRTMRETEETVLNELNILRG